MLELFVHYHEYIVNLIIFPFPQTRTPNTKHAQSDDLTAKAKINGNWINVGVLKTNDQNELPFNLCSRLRMYMPNRM